MILTDNGSDISYLTAVPILEHIWLFAGFRPVDGTKIVTWLLEIGSWKFR